MTTTSVASCRIRDGAGLQDGTHTLAEETPVALSYDGATQAVMMATPADLEDFARGFTLTEGIARPEEVAEIAIVELDTGIDLQIRLADNARSRLTARRRFMAGPVGCGLCGLDSIEATLRQPEKVPASALTLSADQIAEAMAALPGLQQLHTATRAVHAAAFFRPGQGIAALREDVGRHNALDKLAGAMVQAGLDATSGSVLLTSRVSIDMVQKTAAIGAPVLIAVSAPTAFAVRLADDAGITLVALVRGQDLRIFTHPQRINEGRPDHVA